MSAVPIGSSGDEDAAATSGAGAGGRTEAGAVAFWTTAAIGGALVAFGVHGLWANERRGFRSAATWFVGGALALDLLIVPLGALTGWIAKRVVPAWTWPVVRTVLLTSVVLIVFAAPLVLDEGGVPGNPTVRPRDYGAGLAAALAVIWAIGAGALLAIRVGRLPATTSEHPNEDDHRHERTTPSSERHRP